MQRSTAILVSGIDLGTIFYQCYGYGRVALLYSPVQRGVAILASGIDLGTIFYQCCDYVSVAI